jgi:hypothetical protein
MMDEIQNPVILSVIHHHQNLSGPVFVRYGYLLNNSDNKDTCISDVARYVIGQRLNFTVALVR